MEAFMKLVLSLAVCAACALPASAQVTCSKFGNQTQCSNGQSFTKYGNTTYDNFGNIFTNYGNQQFGTNGQTISKYGNRSFDNEGNSWTTYGDQPSDRGTQRQRQ
jgi:hypothetical protein